MELATQKQVSFILKLDQTKKEEDLKELTIKDASIMIRKLLKEQKEPKAKAKEKVNKYGVKVGDLYSASWGYEQTNVDFFQVVELVGETMVRVKEVMPVIVETKEYGAMSRTAKYKNTNELLEPVKCSVFIKDQEKGDLKKIKVWGSETYFGVSSFTDAYKYKGENLYESWYY
jgi:hypothetical protein